MPIRTGSNVTDIVGISAPKHKQTIPWRKKWFISDQVNELTTVKCFAGCFQSKFKTVMYEKGCEQNLYLTS